MRTAKGEGLDSSRLLEELLTEKMHIDAEFARLKDVAE